MAMFVKIVKNKLKNAEKLQNAKSKISLICEKRKKKFPIF